MGRGVFSPTRRGAGIGTRHSLDCGGADGLYCANAVGTCGSVAVGQNWDRRAGAVRRWALKLGDAEEVSILLFSEDALSW